MLHQDLMTRTTGDEPAAVEAALRCLATRASDPRPGRPAWRFALAVMGNVLGGSLLIGGLLLAPSWLAVILPGH